MRKFLLNLVLSEPLSLVKKFPYFDNIMEFYVLLEGSINLNVDNELTTKFRV